MIIEHEIETTLDFLQLIIKPEILIEIGQTPEDQLCQFHFGIGSWIRNNMLEEGCRLHDFFIKNNIPHKDGMSSFIIRKLHERLKEAYISYL